VKPELNSVVKFLMISGVSLSLACISPKQKAEYTSREAISTSQENAIKLTITEERYSEPATPMKIRDEKGVPKPVQNWHSEEMMIYRIGPGDVVRVTILVSLEANSYEVMVANDGTIVLPLIGPFPVGGKTVEEARRDIRIAVNEYYVNPQVQLRVTQHNSQKIYLVGAPAGSSIVPLTKRTTLFEVLNELGADVQNKIDMKSAYLMRNGRIYPLHLEDLMEGDLSYNYELVDNDILYLPTLSEKRVYLLGEIQKPGMYSMLKDDNLFFLIARAGGPRPGAQLREIRIIRGGLEDPTLITVDMQPMMKRRPASQLSRQNLAALGISVEATRKSAVSLEKLYLQDGDIVFLPPTALERWNQIIQQISPTMSFAFTRPILVARDIIYLQEAF